MKDVLDGLERARAAAVHGTEESQLSWVVGPPMQHTIWARAMPHATVARATKQVIFVGGMDVARGIAKRGPRQPNVVLGEILEA
jgi:hypothetical protein